MRGAVVGLWACPGVSSASPAHLLGLQDAPAEPACTHCPGLAYPVLPDWLVLDGGCDLSAGGFASSLDLAAAGEARTPGATAGTECEEVGFLGILPAQPGGFNRVFFSPSLFGTGSDRLPWTKWLPLAGKLATSWAALGLSGGLSLWDSFSFRVFILEGPADTSFIGFSMAKRVAFPLTDDARGGSSLLVTLFCATACFAG